MTSYNIKDSFFPRFGTLLILFLFIILAQLFFQDIPLLSISNLKMITVQATVLGLVAIGLSIVMMCGEIDLSYAGSIGMLGSVFAGLLKIGMDGFLAVLITIGLSLIVGVLNGFFVSQLKFSSSQKLQISSKVHHSLKRSEH